MRLLKITLTQMGPWASFFKFNAINILCANSHPLCVATQSSLIRHNPRFQHVVRAPGVCFPINETWRTSHKYTNINLLCTLPSTVHMQHYRRPSYYSRNTSTLLQTVNYTLFKNSLHSTPIACLYARVCMFICHHLACLYATVLHVCMLRH